MGDYDFKFDGDDQDYKAIIGNVGWLLDSALEKGIKEMKIKVTEGTECNYIKGLIADTFSESGVKITLG